MFPSLQIGRTRVWKWLSLIMLSSLSLMQVEQVNAQTQRPNYRTVLPVLQQKTRIPILLPSLLSTDMPVYGNIDTATNSGYSVNLDYTPDCNGAAVCTYGFLSASKLAENAKRPHGKAVSLASGMIGYFLSNDPEQNCNTGYCFASLTWDLRGVRYAVELKSDKESDLIQAANSAIRSVYLPTK